MNKAEARVVAILINGVAVGQRVFLSAPQQDLNFGCSGCALEKEPSERGTPCAALSDIDNCAGVIWTEYKDDKEAS